MQINIERVTKLEAKEIAAKIYQILKAGQKDPGLVILTVFKLIKDTDIDEVIDCYEKILSNNLSVADITTARPLEPKEKTEIEAFIGKKFEGELVFSYFVDKKIVGGLLVRVGDKVLDVTLKRKILDTK